jgi:hypothetical protein
MTGGDDRPIWVRLGIPRRATRIDILIRFWFGVIAVALILSGILVTMPATAYSLAPPAIVALMTVWEWLAFLWVERHGAWPRPDA